MRFWLPRKKELLIWRVVDTLRHIYLRGLFSLALPCQQTMRVPDIRIECLADGGVAPRFSLKLQVPSSLFASKTHKLKFNLHEIY